MSHSSLALTPGSVLRYSFSFSQICSWNQCFSPPGRAYVVSQGRSRASVSSKMSLLLVLPGISLTMYPLLRRNTAACAALLYITGPVSKKACNLVSGVWKRMPLSRSVFLGGYIFLHFVLHLCCIVMIKIHPFILDTEFFFPSAVKDLFFDRELEEMNHHRAWQGTWWWFRCHGAVRAQSPVHGRVHSPAPS